MSTYIPLLDLFKMPTSLQASRRSVKKYSVATVALAQSPSAQTVIAGRLPPVTLRNGEPELERYLYAYSDLSCSTRRAPA